MLSQWRNGERKGRATKSGRVRAARCHGRVCQRARVPPRAARLPLRGLATVRAGAYPNALARRPMRKAKIAPQLVGRGAGASAATLAPCEGASELTDWPSTTPNDSRQACRPANLPPRCFAVTVAPPGLPAAHRCSASKSFSGSDTCARLLGGGGSPRKSSCWHPFSPGLSAWPAR